MRKQLALKVDKLGKRYTLGVSRTQHDTLRDLLVQGIKSVVPRRGQRHVGREAFWALRDVTFEVNQGENVGIIGMNGAGKSTLLKILSRITAPTSGNAQIVGRVGALLEVGTGFHAELTGRENIYLYGSILGMSKKEINLKFDAIVGFSGIDDFIDTPVKRYSSGMYVRLAFSVAAHLEPEILLLDEVLAVGDLPFQRKCIELAKRLQQADSTILFVSHNMFSIKNMCGRAIYLKNGRLVFDGPTDQAIEFYENDCRLSTLPYTESSAEEWPIFLTDFVTLDNDGATKTIFDHGERLKLRFRYEIRAPVETPNFIVAFVRSDGVLCCSYSTEADSICLGRLSLDGFIEMVTPPLRLTAELYTIHVLVREKGLQRVLCAQIGGTFHVRDQLFDAHFGVFHESAQWAWGVRGEVDSK